MIEKSFLWDYISRRFTEEQDPQRAGTPRGEKIGFTRQKHLAAALVGLTNLKPKDILGLQISGVKIEFGYAVLRKWKTEKEFKEAMAETVNDFANKFILEWESLIKKDHAITDDYLKGKIEEYPSNVIDFRRFYGGSLFFNKNVVSKIKTIFVLRYCDVIQATEKEEISPRRLTYFFSIMDFLEAVDPQNNPKTKLETPSKYELLDNFLNFIEKGNLSQDEIRENVRGAKLLLYWMKVAASS
jgi:hypothetical protein